MNSEAYKNLNSLLDERLKWFVNEAHRYDYYTSYAEVPYTYEDSDLDVFPGRRKYVPRILLYDVISIWHMTLLEIASSLSDSHEELDKLWKKIDQLYDYMHKPFVETQIDMANFQPKEV